MHSMDHVAAGSGLGIPLKHLRFTDKTETEALLR